MEKFLKFIDIFAVVFLGFTLFYPGRPLPLAIGVVAVAFVWIVSHAINYIQRMK